MHLILLFLAHFSAQAGTLTFHLSQPQDNVQSESGRDADDPISPGISVGPHFNLSANKAWKFAPELGYIRNQVTTKDPYGGKPEVETIFILYDFSYAFGAEQRFAVRFGLGNFMKRIKGKGGTVPDGSIGGGGFRPGGTQTSYTGSMNLGFEAFFMKGAAGSFFQRYRAFSELFFFEAQDERKRLMTVLVGIGANL